MFSRQERLPRAQFETLLSTGKRVSSKNFMLVLSDDFEGYAVVIPKKVVRLSVARHALKRRILEALRALPLPSSLIVFPRFTASSVNYEDTKKELGDLLSKIRN